MELLILFTDYYFATKAEQVLQAEGIKLRLIPTPPILNNTCGLCILVKPYDGDEDVRMEIKKQILQLLKGANISHSGFYRYNRSTQECEKLT